MLKIPKWSLWSYLILSFAGFVDATYVTVKVYLSSPLSCAFFENCNQVINSSYSKIFGAPVSLLGAIFYLTIFLLSVYYLDVKRDLALKAIFFLTAFGFVFSLYLLYVQAFLLNQFCLYCLVSALISIILFLNTVFNLTTYYKLPTINNSLR
ncbi:MAG: vitamin K epoxide reductase family protein [Candidatus Wolfebacteria bacterium]|nr:vitamin K epoxide reductase family protein [Candidatus Wolfebacteria bacterium]